MKQQKISNEPYKGTQDYFPADMQKLQYIFDTWRKVCKSYGYEEYLTPVIERAEIYEAKSGEDIAKEQYVFEDKGGRRVSLRPEMTPSVTRMVTRIYNGAPKPIRFFSIANFFRGEKPQKGRSREFWQLNYDIFGETSIMSDLEILTVAIDIMLALGATEDKFVLKINNRKLINSLFTDALNITDPELKKEITRKMDKFGKISTEEFAEMLTSLGLNQKQVETLATWMQTKESSLSSDLKMLENTEGYKEIQEIFRLLEDMGYSKYVEFSPDLIRGFDYYDGTVFEAFDKNPEFSRSLFGGGRYNGLSSIFGVENLPAVGAAPGDVPIAIFLDNWDLWPDFSTQEKTYLPMIEENSEAKYLALAQKLRSEGKNVELSTSLQALGKALKYANAKGFGEMVIFGAAEMEKGEYLIKDLESSEQKAESL